ncbi:esterase/lipase family protein [Sphingomonas sp.]|uniref:esterase/lipase family protein n=1 Tax=Sphingomonas sp. TaxID=28214 RepID=UPI002DD6B21A|nr:alpha/beta hydrolase [Sphingomonas sp.]
MTDGDTVPAPSKFLALTELPRALFELSTLPWALPALMAGPRGDGHPVLVLPGFITSDVSTGILRRFLTAKGYDAHSWNLGRNLGPKAIGREGEKLIARLEEIHAATGQKVSLVGWSLGGVMARLLANWRPDLVRQVITLGSPFGGDPKASNVWRTYEALTGDRIEGETTTRLRAQSAVAPPVPTTAIFTKADGIVAWQNCREGECDTTDNIEVYGSHCGLGVNPAVLHAVADRLALAEGEFVPFERKGLGRVVYPSSGHRH